MTYSSFKESPLVLLPDCPSYGQERLQSWVEFLRLTGLSQVGDVGGGEYLGVRSLREEVGHDL